MSQTNANSFRPVRYSSPTALQQSHYQFYPVLITALAMFGFQCAPFLDVGLPRLVGWGPGVSLALFMMMPMLVYALPSLFLPMQTQMTRWPVLMLMAFLFWCMLRLPLSPNLASIRALTTPIGMVLITCGTAAIFYRHWTSLHRALPAIIYFTVIAFNFWMAISFSIGLAQEGIRGTYETGIVSQYAVSGLLSTQLALYIGIQLCYCLFLLRAKRGFRLLNLGLIALSAVNVVAISGSRAAIVGVGLVFAMYIFSGSFTRQIRLAFVAGIILFMTAGMLAPHIASLLEKTETLIQQEERENVRVVLYQDVWENAVEHPLLGMGLGGYLRMRTATGDPKVPHQNLLGLACEAGFPAAGFYLLFIITTFLALWVRNPRPQDPKIVADARYFITACLWVFAYLQLRGLATDTWTLKEMYFCVGAGLGLRIWLGTQAVRYSNPQAVVQGILPRSR